jgi:hypothetical protein
MGKKSGSGINNPDHISESLETFFWVKIHRFFDADPGSGMEKIRIRDNTDYKSTHIDEEDYQSIEMDLVSFSSTLIK